MNKDCLALKIFNRLNDYLKKYNVHTMFKIENETIYFYSCGFNTWFKWFLNINLSLDKACEWFLLGSPEKFQSKTCHIISYESFFVFYNHSTDSIVKQICNYIGKPTCLEEIALKMDLMGI